MDTRLSEEIEHHATQDVVSPRFDPDSTLTHADLLIGSILLPRRNPLSLFMMPYRFAAGKANLKEQIVRRVRMNIGSLPYNERPIGFCKNERDKGLSISLCAAANERFAKDIAEHFGLIRPPVRQRARQRAQQAFGREQSGHPHSKFRSSEGLRLLRKRKHGHPGLASGAHPDHLRLQGTDQCLHIFRFGRMYPSCHLIPPPQPAPCHS